MLADGVKMSQGALLSKNGAWPLYSSLSRGKGLLWSWVSFDSTLTNDLHGRLSWRRPASPSPKYYTNGISAVRDLTGSRYVAPIVAAERILAMTNAVISFNGGNRGQLLEANLILGLKAKVTNDSPHKLSLKFASSGLFSGTMREAGASKAFSFKGAVLQKANMASGYFLGTNQSGRVRLRPAP